MTQRRRSKLTMAAGGTLPRASLAAARETNEGFRVWHQAFAERVELPAPASVIGEPVTVVDVDCVIVRCRHPDGREYSVSLRTWTLPMALHAVPGAPSGTIQGGLLRLAGV